MRQAEHANHELILAVEREVELGVPAPLQIGHRPQGLGETQDGTVRGVAVDLLLVEREISSRGVELARIAEAGDAPELLDRVAG